MSLNEDQEILEDFLIEAGEILETLSEELVDLENHPDDKDLLLSIFRGFHTLKGGASFLGFESMVELSHKTEDIIEAIRTKRLDLTSEVMDIILISLDSLQDIRECLVKGKDIPAKDLTLVSDLERLCDFSSKPKQAADSAVIATLNRLHEFKASLESTIIKETDEQPSEEFSEDDFEDLLDDIYSRRLAPRAQAPEANLVNKQDINASAEFDIDELLDEFYGVGQVPGQGKRPAANSLKNASCSEKAELESMDDRDYEDLLQHLVADQKYLLNRQRTREQNFQQRRMQRANQNDDNANTKDDARVITAADQSIRVNVKRLDDIINMVGELVLVRNRLSSVSENSRDEALKHTSQNLDSVTRNLQSATIKTRLQPIRRVFSRFPRLIRDLARSLDKSVSLTLIGEDTELDKNVVDAMAEPLIHLVRNAIDHGIERAETRIDMGKAERGEISLSARQEGDYFILVVKDDGRGMNVEKIKQHAIDKLLITEGKANSLTDNELLQLILIPGFSTNSEVTDISGRGVGMDVVNTTVKQLNGSINISSRQFEGSQIEIKIPASIAIFSALIVQVVDQLYAIPVSQVREVIKVSNDMLEVQGNNQLFIRHENSKLPVISLHDWQQKGDTEIARVTEPYVIIYELDSMPVALMIDRVIGQEEVVIKTLNKAVEDTLGIAGATLTAEGSIALVLDVPILAREFSGLG